MRGGRLLACLLAWLGCAASQAAVEAADDRAVVVRLAAPALRIVSLTPHATELLFAAGAGHRVVGVASHSDFPAAARTLPRVGDAVRIDMERVIALRPDLVIAWRSGNSPADVARLEALGIAVYVTEARRLEDIPRHLTDLARLAGTEVAARPVVDAFNAELAALRDRYAERNTLRVFYQLSAEPLYTLNGAHLVSRVLELCGGRNVFGELPSLAPVVGLEDVLAADPQVVLVASTKLRDALVWQRWPNMAAVRGGRVHRVDPDLLHRATPRILQGASQVCEILSAPPAPATARP